MKSLVVALVVCLLLAPIDTRAQSFTATVQGTVTDSSGAVVPTARISLTNEATNVKQEKQANERGAYLFTLVPPGAYKLVVEAAGFQTSVRSGMQLQVQQQASVDIVLTVGDVTTSVVVAGETPRLDAVNATLGRVVENESVLSMPLPSRSILDLANLAPGVVGAPGGTGTNFLSNGVRNSQSDVLIDGVTAAVHEQGGGATDVKFRPTVESVQEFKVQTNSFSAEYGFTGGAVVNVVTRSGANEFHGSLFEFLRNSSLNANQFFSNRAGRAIVPFSRNQFGGAVGGPVWIPGVYKGSNKTFFFFHQENTKQSSQTTTTQTLPTALQKSGNFSQTLDANGRLIQIFDPFAVTRDAANNPVRAPFAGNLIPGARFNPVAVNAIKFYPEPNQAGIAFTQTSNFFNSGASRSSAYQNTSKIDHNFNDRQRLSVRYSRSADSSTPPNFWGEGNWMVSTGNEPTRNTTNNPSVDYTHTFGPTTVMSLRWGLARQFGLRSFACGGKCDFSPSTLGFQGPWDSPIPPQFSPEGFQAVGINRFGLIRRGEDANHFIGSLTKMAGRHTIKFGGEARLYRLNYAQPGLNHASFSFSRQVTMQSPFTANSSQGNGLASFLLGWGTGDEASDAAASWAYQSYGLFYQQDIQLTKSFTVNLGLRYELPIPEKERYDRASWFNPLIKAAVSTPAYPNLRGGIEFATQGNDFRSPHDTDKNNWAPRIGFAWLFRPKMVMRAGYGIYYGITRAQISSPLGPGFRTSTSWTSSLDANVTLYTPVSVPFKDGLNLPPGSSKGLMTNVGLGTGLAPIRDWDTTPYFQQWSYSIERELPANSVVEIAYSGSRGVHLGFDTMAAQNRISQSFYTLGTRLNDVVENPFFGVITDPLSTLSRPTVTRNQLLRPYPHFTSVGAWPAPPIADSIYNALQFKFTKRYSHGLNLSGHYTFAKMIDDNSLASSGQSFLGGQTPIQNYDNHRLERAVSVRDITHRGVIDFAYDLPIGRGKALGRSWNRAVDMALGGWQVNAIFILQSGNPLVPNLQNGVLPEATQRPNLLREPGLPGTVQARLDKYLDPDAFSRPASYVFGNGPRTLSRARGPGLTNADMSLFKELRFSRDGRFHLQIRGEAFNITNTPIFAAPNVTVGSTAFGVISGQANGPRQLQLALKLYF
ncbi:MAG: TonB-dependent receptor domain-containing protein [Bryobacteraceae bacterium]